MRGPRLRLGRLMVLLLVLGLNFGLVRQLPSMSNRAILAVLGSIVMANALGYAIYRLVFHRDEAQTRARGFWKGFLAAGGAVTFTYSQACLVGPERLVYPLVGTVNAIHDLLRSHVPEPFAASLSQGAPVATATMFAATFVLIVTAFGLPQLLIAFLGGWLGSRYQTLFGRRGPATPR